MPAAHAPHGQRAGALAWIDADLARRSLAVWEGLAAQYAELADAAIAQVHGRGRAVIVCGGTGLYLRALRDGLFPGPGGDPELRAELRALGLDLTLLNAAYPHEVFQKAVAAGAKAWFPGEPPEESWFKVGQLDITTTALLVILG
mgnify:CR=1 FL=1